MRRSSRSCSGARSGGGRHCARIFLRTFPVGAATFASRGSTGLSPDGCAGRPRPIATIAEHVADILGFPGAMTLELSYLFACTTSADPRSRGHRCCDGLIRLAFSRARQRRGGAWRFGRRGILQRDLAGCRRRADRYGARPVARPCRVESRRHAPPTRNFLGLLYDFVVI